MTLGIRNPHSVLAALKARPQDVQSITVPGGGSASNLGEAWDQVLDLAKRHKIQINSAPKRKPNESNEGGRQGGAEASIKEKAGVTAEELFANAPSRQGGK